ncbi:MAG TPA: S8 family serine peptidase [Pyrinomonadaceae bacterium]|nr:S8 family serine peptidase [Pyrinomonadaceae bacterium]
MNKNRTRVSRFKTRPKLRGNTRALVLSLLVVACTLAAVASGALFSNKIRRATASPALEDISPEALAQIDALIREKESRTDVQKKIDSQLIYQLKMNQGLMVADSVSSLQTDVAVDNQGKTTVDITAPVTNALVAALQAQGAEILSARNNSIRANVPLDNLEAIAALDEVRFVQPKQNAMTSNETSRLVDDKSGASSNYQVAPDFGQRVARVQSFLANALQGGAQTNVTGTNAPSGVGSRSSEGDVTHRANIARGTFHVDGTGIKIGVLSNGVASLAQSQALGDLGPVTVLPGQAGTGDEGTAMLEIVHDLAPGAQLFFATANTGITVFAQNIRDLRTAGCDIIVDDVFYFVETPFQDGQTAPSNTNGGVVTQAVNDVTAAGAMYFSSAGNSGNLTQGTSGVWEGDFVDGGAAAAPLPSPTPASRLHNFGGQNFNVLNVANTAAPVSLYWSDPLGASANDYDLFRLNSTGTTVQASSTNIQSGTQDPYEQVTQAAGSRLVIVKKAGSADRFLHLNTNRGQLSIRTAGQTHGHSQAADAYSVAATPAVGPFPNPFSTANITENFTSDGPRRTFFQGNGTAYTPGNFSSTGGLVRQKPDITAADGVQVTGVGGFGSPFFGTSAAAPHAAAIAALMKSANPTFTPAQIRTALTSSAIDIMSAGTDNVSGVGIIDAFSATQALGVTGTAFLQATTITALENPGNGNGVLDAGENATMSIQLRNDGVNSATAISATLSSSTPGVTVTQANSAYPDLAVGATGTNTTAFQFSIAGFVQCPTTLNFSLTLNYTGGPSQVINFTVLSGPQPTVISSTLDTTTAPSGAGFTGSTGVLAIRHFRDGIPSSCGSQKAFPGTSTPGNHQYDAYEYHTCANSGPTCVTVTLSAANGVNLFSAAYLGTFNPANLAQNYVADAGGSNTTVSYSFNLPAGAQTFTVVVEDVPVGAASNSPYTLSVSGACVGICPVVPVLASNGQTLSQESCPAFNGAVDPGERVSMNLKVINNGTAATSNLVGTLQASANVIAPSGPTSFGSIPAGGGTAGRDFSFTAVGNCGDLVTLALKLQDGAVDFGTVFYSFRLGAATPGTQLSENFDGVTAPSLPAGWSSTGSGAEPAWVTSTTNPFSAPNAAFAPNTATQGVTELVSPSIHINGQPAQVSFRNAFNVESGFDGGVLEISINGGPYQDILVAGGSFVSGGYTGVMSAGTLNPLTGRSGWTGLSGGTTAAPAYITTVVNLPAAASGQNIQLKWRMGSDELIAAAGTQPGQRVDNIVVTDTSYFCTTPCGSANVVVTSTLVRQNATTVVANITLQNIGAVTANNVVLNNAKLGTTNGTPLPQSLGNLAPGATVNTTVNFTNSTPGAASNLAIGGTYTGGSFSTTKRVTIP